MTVALGLLPRLLWLGSVPPALHPDEVANAADAAGAELALSYAHERGGRVEGVYVWLAMPSMRLARALGWPSLEAAARLPAALAGCLLLIALAWAAAELSRLGRGRVSWGFVIGATLCLALQPWAWHTSRLALRATLTPLCLCVGLAAWLRAEAAPRPWPWAILAGGALAAAALTYAPVRLAVPWIACGLWFSRDRASARGREATRALRCALALAVAATLLLLPFTLWGGGASRLDAVLALDPQEPAASLWRCLRGYFGHFGPRFLFSGSSSRGFSPERVGLIPHWQIPALALGIVGACVQRGRRGGILVGGLLLFPLAASFTRDAPNALRAILGLPLLALMAGQGWQLMARYVAQGRKAGGPRAALCAALVAGLALWAGWEEARLARAYFVTHPRLEAAFYYPGRRELVRRAAALAAEGRGVTCELPFLEASLRLYAPQLEAQRLEGERWALGPGAGEVELRVELSPEGQVRLVEAPIRSGSKRP